METITTVVLPSSYCLLSASAQIHAAFLPVHSGEMSVLPAKTHLSTCKSTFFHTSKKLAPATLTPSLWLSSFPSPSDISIVTGALVCSYFSHHKSPSLTPFPVPFFSVSNVLVPAFLDPLAHECIIWALHSALTYALFGLFYYIFLSSSFPVSKLTRVIWISREKVHTHSNLSSEIYHFESQKQECGDRWRLKDTFGFQEGEKNCAEGK